ncbi:MAG: hypothetical protein WCV84_02820 [Patescibacteria group bacterium]
MKYFIFTQYFGLPLAAYLGILTLTSLLVTAYIGYTVFTKSGKTKLTINMHVWMARITIVIALIHGLTIMWAFLG